MDPDDARGARPRRSRGRSRSTALAVLIVTGLAVGVAVWRAGDTPERPATRAASAPASPRQYFVTLGDSAVGSLRDGVYVRVTVDGATNLPDGTVAGVTWNTTSHGGDVNYGESPIVDGQPASAVHNGVLSIVIEPGCAGLGTGFDVSVEISPVFHDLAPPNHPVDFPWPPRQPGAVVGALGARFQRLAGDQVSVADDPGGPIHRIVLRGSYDWPTAPPSFVPHGCAYPGA